MGLVLRRPSAFSVCLLIVNVAAAVWIHHDLTAASVPRLRVLTALPSRDIDATDRFSLVFDEPVVTARAVGAPLTDSPFLLTPAVAGTWTWSAPDKLEYLLQSPLSPGRRYTLRASPTLERITGRRIIGESEFRFETRPLRVVTCELASSDRTHATLEFLFNQAVAPADFMRHLKITDSDGAKIREVRVMGQAPSPKLQVRLARPSSGKMRIHLAPKLTGSQGELPLGQAWDEQRELKARFSLLRAEVETPELSGRASARVHFSRPLDAHQTLPLTRFEPAVEGVTTRVADGALLIEGSFRSGTTYEATFSSNLLADDGEPLGEEESTSLAIPDRRPEVQFVASSGVLSPLGNLKLELKAVNLAGLNVRAARVHANNLVAHLRGSAARDTSRQLAARTFTLDAPPNRAASLSLDLRELLSQPLGIYSIEATATDRTWTSAQSVVAITDLGMTAKSERGGYLVWVTSLRTGQPVAGVTVTAMSYNNQALASAGTDMEGLARLSIPTPHPDGPPFALVAQHDDDLSFLKPEEQAWALGDWKDLGGKATPANYDIMLFTERGVYRPGDTVHLSGIVRDAEGNTPPPFPLTLTVRRPDGRAVAELPVTIAPESQGLFQIDYATRDDGHLGPYRFAVSLPGSSDTLGQTDALVEEFLPARIDVQASTTQKTYAPGQHPQVHLAGRYLFNQPASGLAFTLTGQYRQDRFASSHYPEFTFDAPPGNILHPLVPVEGKLNPQGLADIDLEGAPADAGNLWLGDLTFTVHEDGGRSVSSTLSFVQDTAGAFVGLNLPSGRIVTVGAQTPIAAVRLKGTGDVAAGSALHLTLQRVENETSLQRLDNRYVWSTIEHLSFIEEREMPASAFNEGAGRFFITCPTSGHYRLDVRDCETARTTRMEFDALNAGISGDVALEGSPERLRISLDRECYEPGATAHVLIDSPFPGKMLLTLEAERVLYSKVISVTAGRAEIEVPVDERIRGGAFVAATLVRPVDPKAVTWLPHRAMGIARLQTQHKSHELPLTLSAPRRVLPGEVVTIDVHAAPSLDPGRPAVLQIWAVDEGILMTTGYRTPDPVACFFAPRRLEVASSDVFGDLLPDYLPASSGRIGGDGDNEEAMRRNPVTSRRREAAVIWQKLVQLRSDGTATLNLNTPRMTGEMRLMAVGVDGDRYGSAQQAITVTSPLLVEASCPRFIAPGDQCRIPVKVFNTTETPVEARLSAKIDGPATLQTDDLPARIVVRPGEPVTTWLHVTGTGLGPVSLHAAVETSSDGGSLHADATEEFVVRPARPLQSEFQVVSLKAGERLQIPASEKFIENTVQTKISVSGSPVMNLLPAVEQLMDYPYGCVEQTTSQIYALLYAPDLLSQAGASGKRAASAKDMIAAGLSRLRSMQTRSGGLAYWPGSREPDLWGTTYATGALITARRLGHDVDSGFLKELSEYLAREMDTRGEEGPDNDLRAELCHVLAALQHPAAGWMTRLSEHADELDRAGRAHLVGAWIESGRKDRAAATLPPNYSVANMPTTTSGRLTSSVQADAVLLSVLIDMDPQHPWIPLIALRLEKARKAGAWGSTLENAAALAAMAKFQLLSPPAGHFEGMITAPGQSPRPFSSGATETARLRGNVPLAIDSKGDGIVSLCITRQGLLQDAPHPVDRGLKATRRWTTRDGKPVDPMRLHVGDLVLVETTLAAQARSDDSVDNVAIVDALPGGFEVENPRLITSEKKGSENSEADRVEFHDDRVVIFTSADSHKKKFHYALRAVSIGQFEQPPIEASCMYDTGYSSIREGGRVEIVP